MKLSLPAALAVAVFLALGLSLGGCSDDESPTVPECGELDALRFPATADQLMANFRTVYETMDVDGYRQLLTPDFATYLQPETREEFPDVGPTLDLAEEMVIARRMFSGEAVVNSQGNLVPGISGVDFAVFQQQGEWAVSAATDSIPGTPFALFDVVLLLDRPGNSTLRVQGVLKFYAASRDTVVCGENRTFYRMRGQTDLTGQSAGKGGVEGTTWGSVKALFW